MTMRVGKPYLPVRCRVHGFTMVEMMITVVILAVLLAIAVPSMREMIARKRVVGVATELATDLRYLRSTYLQSTLVELARVRFSSDSTMSCYSLFATSGLNCNCTNLTTPVCGSNQIEFKTVRVARSTGVVLSPAQDTASVLAFWRNVALPFPAGSTIDISVKSDLGGELRVRTNATGLPSICSVTGHQGAFPPCS